MRGTRFLGLVLFALLFAGGCRTAVGNYFANRAKDFGECFRLEVGVGVGMGAGGRALGVFEGGLGMYSWYRPGTVGVVWGEWLPSIRPEGLRWNAQASTPVGFGWTSINRTPSYVLYGAINNVGYGDTRIGEQEYGVQTWLAPALLSFRVHRDRHGNEQKRWIWHPPPPVPAGASLPPGWWRKARIHAFDIEAHAFAGFVGVGAGFSPGEFLDFLLGWFGLDIAGDDHAWTAPPPRDAWR